MPLLMIIRCDNCSSDCTNNYNMFTIYKHFSNPNDYESVNERPQASQEIFLCDDCLNRIFNFPLEFRFDEEETY